MMRLQRNRGRNPSTRHRYARSVAILSLRLQRTWVLPLSLLGLGFGVAVGFAGCAGAPLAPLLASPEAGPAAEVGGLRVASLRLTADGYMLDLRYRVVDAARALPVLRVNREAYLLHQVSAARFLVPDTPKLGALRQRVEHPAADKTYFIFFANPDRYLKAGDKVTLVIGDNAWPNLTIE
jgi:hypothetical protein